MDIYINKDGQQYGPYKLDQVNEYLAQGSFQATDPAWSDGLANWCPLNQIAGVVDPSSPTPPSFDPTTYNPNAAPPPAVASPSPTEAPVTAASVTCPGCQASVAPEMLFCATCGYDLQAGWQDMMTSFPADAPQAEGSANSGQLLVSTNGPQKLPAPISSRIIAGIFAPIGLALMVPGCWGLSGPILGFRKVFGVLLPREGDFSNQSLYIMGGMFIIGLAVMIKSIQGIIGARLCSECKRRITKYDATCPGCKAMFERPT